LILNFFHLSSGISMVVFTITIYYQRVHI
jgi:hypothetical protein